MIHDESARLIDDALLNAEDFMAVSMWDEALAALEALPQEARSLPHVILVYLDIYIGQRHWHRGLGHALALVEKRPNDSELWLRMARLMAGMGDSEGAYYAATRCLQLNPGSACFLAKNGLLPDNRTRMAA